MLPKKDRIRKINVTEVDRNSSPKPIEPTHTKIYEVSNLNAAINGRKDSLGWVSFEEFKDDLRISQA